MATVVIVLCICWCLLWITSSICDINPLHKVCRNPDAKFVKYVLAYSNSAITLFIYPFFSANFRMSFKRILHEMFCCKRGRVDPLVNSVWRSDNQRETVETQMQRFGIQCGASKWWKLQTKRTSQKSVRSWEILGLKNLLLNQVRNLYGVTSIGLWIGDTPWHAS